MLILSKNVDQKSLETEFSIVICRPSGDKWQSKTLFLLIFDPPSSIIKSILIAPYLVWYQKLVNWFVRCCLLDQ